MVSGGYETLSPVAKKGEDEPDDFLGVLVRRVALFFLRNFESHESSKSRSSG